MSRKFYFCKKWPLLPLVFQYACGTQEFQYFRHLQCSCSLSQYIYHQENWTMKYVCRFCGWFSSCPTLQFVGLFGVFFSLLPSFSAACLCCSFPSPCPLCVIHSKPMKTGGYWWKPPLCHVRKVSALGNYQYQGSPCKVKRLWQMRKMFFLGPWQEAHARCNSCKWKLERKLNFSHIKNMPVSAMRTLCHITATFLSFFKEQNLTANW